jgi:uncharacterized protein YigA (DUF484 family)
MTNNILKGSDVLQWLKDNPDFLTQYPQAYDLLLPPAENKGRKLADFQHYMMKRLRTDRDKIIESARQIIENSRENMNNHARIQRAVLLLLEAPSFEEFIRIIVTDFPAILLIDVAAIVVEAEDGVVPHIFLNGVRLVTSGSIDNVMRKNAIMLESNIRGLEALYGGASGLVKSQALCRLFVANESPKVMLALGSRDPNLFNPDQPTDQLQFMCSVIERCFHLWLRQG